MKIEVRSSTRGPVHVVEVWIGGRCFVLECASAEEARKLVLDTVRDLKLMEDS